MRQVQIRDAVPGMRLGREIVTENGISLLGKGVCLTPMQIEILASWGIHSLCIDDYTVDPSDISPIPEKELFMKQYHEVVDTVRITFQTAKHYKQIPIREMHQIASKMISPLVKAANALDYLYEMRLHSDNTFHHSVNVAVVTGIFGRWRNYSGAQYEHLVLGGLLHDIGKIFIPLSILHKPDKLSDAEFAVIKRHPEKGYDFTKDLQEISEGTKLAVRQHHERIDGSGYPFGIRGNEIHEYAKIVAIADIYDAMTSDRAYRQSLSPFTAIEFITTQMENKLDPAICLPFLNRMRDFFIGSQVVLSNGQQAKILVLPQTEWTKPIVQTSDGRFLDLKQEQVSIVDFIEI